MMRKQANMLTGKRSAQGGNHVGESRLVKGDNVGVPFDHDGIAGAGHARFCLIEGKQHLRLMENGRIARVQVFWLSLTDNAPAEGDAVAAHVVDGEHNAIEETVVHPLLAAHRNVGIDHLLVGVAKGAQVGNQLAPTGSIPKVP